MSIVSLLAGPAINAGTCSQINLKSTPNEEDKDRGDDRVRELEQPRDRPEHERHVYQRSNEMLSA